MERLYERDPGLYGILDEHVEDIYEALEECDRNYPSSNQLQKELEKEEEGRIRVQELGHALTELEQLSILDVYNGDADPNRYDLTGYDEEMMVMVKEYFDRENLNSEG